jgi:hypothetical protein
MEVLPGGVLNFVTSDTLSRLFPAQAARLGTLHELNKTTRVAILGDALGYSPATVDRHTRDSAGAHARYVAARA